jgi:hypothetical protein
MQLCRLHGELTQFAATCRVVPSARIIECAVERVYFRLSAFHYVPLIDYIAAHNSGDVMRKLMTTAVAVSCLSFSSSASAEIEQKDASYYCVAEIAGGLSYDGTTKKWAGAVFKATDKIVLRLKFVDTQKGTLSLDKGITYKHFRAVITAPGAKSGIDCVTLGDTRQTVAVGNYAGFSCYAGYSEYTFNLDTNRYLKVYDMGYADGADNNENTPAIVGGVCTKID